MAQVVVTIAGRIYRMNCEDGQEAHIEALAYDLAARMEGLRGAFGEIGEQRLTMMTALTVVDELMEARKKIVRLEQDLAEAQTQLSTALHTREAANAALSNSLNTAAERIERVVRDLLVKV